MGFPTDAAEDLLVKCHRRCCICHRFCGVKMELDHCVPTGAGGSDDIENAIPVCFECHAEINSYNDTHPRGRKLRSSEKKKHRDQWLKICADNPQALIDAPRDSGVGPLQAMIDELQYNIIVAERLPSMLTDAFRKAAGLFRDEQFDRAISQGCISILNDDLRVSLLTTYAAIGECKLLCNSHIFQSDRDAAGGYVLTQIQGKLKILPATIRECLQKLLEFLGKPTE